ncbi:MAG: thioesterase family protein [Galactobacter sp.]
MHAPDQLPPDLSSADAYYELVSREGDTGTFRSTVHAQGAWNVGEQHMGPATGLLIDELTRYQPRDGVRLARVSLDIIGFIPGGEFTVTTRLLRPGRTIELVEAVMEAHGRTSIRARAWRLATQDTSEVACVHEPALAGRDTMQPWDITGVWGGGFIASLEGCRDLHAQPGTGRVWLTNPYDTVAGQETSEVTKLLGMVDPANGIALSQGPGEWLFPNVDLQIHLFRLPRGRWLGLDTMQTFGADGVGLTSSVLHDEQGPFGRSEQILTLRKRS